MYAIDEEDSEHVEEANDSEEGLQAWCLLEESENEQWQEHGQRKGKQKMKRSNQASLLSKGSSRNSKTKEIMEVRGK